MQDGGVYPLEILENFSEYLPKILAKIPKLFVFLNTKNRFI